MIMKTKEELTALKEEVAALNSKLAELTEEELEQVTGGFVPIPHWMTDTKAGNGGGIQAEGGNDSAGIGGTILPGSNPYIIDPDDPNTGYPAFD